MHILIEDHQTAPLLASLEKYPGDAALQQLAATIQQRLKDEEDEVTQTYVSQAQEEARDGEVEVDDGAIVSAGENEGAYVQAWVWVDSGPIFRKLARKWIAGWTELPISPVTIHFDTDTRQLTVKGAEDDSVVQCWTVPGIVLSWDGLLDIFRYTLTHQGKTKHLVVADVVAVGKDVEEEEAA